jgi:hypothetical protein
VGVDDRSIASAELRVGRMLLHLVHCHASWARVEVGEGSRTRSGSTPLLTTRPLHFRLIQIGTGPQMSASAVPFFAQAEPLRNHDALYPPHFVLFEEAARTIGTDPDTTTLVLLSSFDPYAIGMRSSFSLDFGGRLTISPHPSLIDDAVPRARGRATSAPISIRLHVFPRIGSLPLRSSVPHYRTPGHAPSRERPWSLARRITRLSSNPSSRY